MIDALDQAIYDTIHDFRAANGERGATALAPRIGMNPGTLNNKAYPGHESQLTLRESVPVQREARDYRILAEYAICLDHAVIPLGDFSRTSDAALLDLYCEYHAEIGQTAEAIRDALAINATITRADARKVRRELIEDMQAGLAFLARLDGLVAEDEPDE